MKQVPEGEFIRTLEYIWDFTKVLKYKGKI